MEITSNKEEKIFRKDYNGKPSYSLGLSKKDKDGKFVNGYIKVNFKKGVELNNKSKIKIKNAWIDFYKDNEKTIPTIFINEFDITQEGEKETNPYEEFANSMTTEFDTGEQIQIKPEDLPF